jgi:hypothetical protein
MLSLFSTEFISLIFGGFAGFLFKYLAQKQEDEKQKFLRALEISKKTEESRRNAAKRETDTAGKKVRRAIVLTILFGTVIAPFILPFFDIPVIVESDIKNPEFLFGIIPETTTKVFTQVYGYLMTPENRQILVTIVGFYFGSSISPNK